VTINNLKKLIIYEHDLWILSSNALMMINSVDNNDNINTVNKQCHKISHRANRLVFSAES
jgi:hypothetical protein